MRAAAPPRGLAARLYTRPSATGLVRGLGRGAPAMRDSHRAAHRNNTAACPKKVTGLSQLVEQHTIARLEVGAREVVADTGLPEHVRALAARMSFSCR